jgi:hypothetical protein
MNMMTAIAAVPAVVAAPALAMPVPLDGEPADQEDGQEAYENGLEVARMDAALAWLGKWTAAGGEALVDGDRLALFIPAFGLSRDGAAFQELESQIAQQDWCKRLSDRERERLSEERRSFSRALFDGKMRALSDFLDDLPDVRKTLKDLLKIAPRLGVS